MSDFEELLAKIREDRLPAYGSVAWDGRNRQMTTTVQFEDGHQGEPREVVRDRAIKYLEGLTPEEWEVAEVEVFTRDKKPVRATIKAGTKELPPERLQELKRRAGIKR